jgi:hypothetical protein
MLDRRVSSFNWPENARQEDINSPSTPETFAADCIFSTNRLVRRSRTIREKRPMGLEFPVRDDGRAQAILQSRKDTEEALDQFGVLEGCESWAPDAAHPTRICTTNFSFAIR